MFVCMIELCAAVLMAAAVIIRMTVFAKAPVYVNNALMNANLFALGIAFVIFGLFNLIFVGGFFTTAYKFARPFVIYIITAFTLICIAEALHYFPGLQKLNAFGTDEIGLQSVLLISGIVIWLVLTWLSCRKAYDDFERIDL